MHALIENNVITALRDAPTAGAWEDGAWLDFADPTVLAEWEERHGWTETIPDPANPEQTIPNITKEVFFKRQIKAWAINQAVEFANRQAIAAVVMEADN